MVMPREEEGVTEEDIWVLRSGKRFQYSKKRLNIPFLTINPKRIFSFHTWFSRRVKGKFLCIIFIKNYHRPCSTFNISITCGQTWPSQYQWMSPQLCFQGFQWISCRYAQKQIKNLQSSFIQQRNIVVVGYVLYSLHEQQC